MSKKNVTEKICVICQVRKTLDNFPIIDKYIKRNGSVTVWRRKQCLECYKSNRREWFKNNTNKQKISRKLVLSQYGLDETTYQELLKKQNGRCKICFISQDDYGKNLHVDHCHKTGKVRGLLCSLCNQGLGLFKDRYDVILRASHYLMEDPV